MIARTSDQFANPMPSLSLRDIPEDLYARLKIRASAHRRSLNAEVLTILEGALRSRRLSAESIEERVVRSRTGVDGPLLSEELLARARRTGRP